MDYLAKTKDLIDQGEKSDGCSIPIFASIVHKLLKKSRILCAVHDFGLKGLLEGVKPNLHANWVTVKVHFSVNFLYGLWGLLIMTLTAPWVFWKYHLKIESWDYIGFHVVLFLVITIITLIKIK